MPLPYPGYSWSLTQHADKINAVDVYSLAATAFAARFAPRPNVAANKYLVDLKRQGKVSLTLNIRALAPQPWRDYQQILAELGLMVSTEVVRQPQLTPVGMMLYDGTIGFDELITTQALRYQYPNGLKTDIQSRLASELRRAGRAVPDSRLELDTQNGILIRPAVLILRVLIELERQRRRRTWLTVDQIGSALLPIPRNDRWAEALRSLQTGVRAATDKAARRNIQDWIKLLGKSLVFERRSNRVEAIGLSEYSVAHLDDVEELTGTLEDPGTFWLPTKATLAENRLDWFRFYGTVDLEQVWTPPEDAVDPAYIKENYVVGLRVDDEEEPAIAAPIKLRDFADFQARASGGGARTPVDIASILAGRQRQAQSSVFHDEIVKRLGKRLGDLGYSVEYDPKSIDLYAVREGGTTILEVKTVGPRNILNRLRIGTGQLVEYRRRLETRHNLRPNSILVIGAPSLPAPLAYWTDVLENGAVIGLLGFSRDRFIARTATSIEPEIAGL